jgi:hypothetical protein
LSPLSIAKGIKENKGDKMKKKIYYKAVKEMDGKIVSCVAGNKAEVEYKIGEFVSAPKWLADKDYHLFVFDNLKDAKEFCKCQGIIYKAECEDEIKRKPKFGYHGAIEDGNLDLDCDYDYPDGTKMFKQVKLLKKVKHEYEY